MKSVLLALLVVVAIPVSADHPHVTLNTFWWAEPATDLDVQTGGPGEATIRVNEHDAQYIRIVRVEADLVAIPDTPFTLERFDSLWLALDSYAEWKAKRRDVWLVTLGNGETAVVRRMAGR